MNNFIENLLNPPKNLQVGQIWHIAEYPYDVIITDIKYANKGIVRVAVISDDEGLGDDYDLKINPSDLIHNGINTQSKRLLRLTDCAIHSKELKFYKSSLNSKAISNMLSYIGNINFDYDELTNNILNYYINSIAPFREKALAYLEENNELPDNVILLAADKSIFETQPVRRYEYGLAAGDSSVVEEIERFWDLESEQRESAILVCDNELVRAKFSFVDDVLYLVFFSKSANKISSILIESEGNYNTAIDNELVFSSKRMFTSFKDPLKEGAAKLSFKIDGQLFSFDIILRKNEK